MLGGEDFLPIVDDEGGNFFCSVVSSSSNRVRRSKEVVSCSIAEVRSRSDVPSMMTAECDKKEDKDYWMRSVSVEKVDEF